ncbi:MAG: hypothetical protein K0S33_2935 [Bacteroidetes bacterium]|jgi:hypothetical protein|nr:hypothetical protein [Bacteroidota bacterium]
MKKIFYSAIILMAVSFGAGLKAQSVTYRVQKDDPYDVKNLTVAVDPLFFDLNGENGYAFGWGARANWLMGKRLDINFDMRTGFGTQGYNKSDKFNNTRNYFYTEGSLALTLSHKTRSNNVRVILSQSSYSSGGYTYTNTKSITVPAESRHIVALRGGMYQMTNSINMTKVFDDSLLMFTNKSTGTEFSMQNNSDTIAFIPNTMGRNGNGDLYGGYASTAIFAGFNFKTIRQLIIDVDGYGLRSNQVYSDFYVDCIFSPVIALKNYKAVAKNGKEYEYDLKYEGGKRAIGWRAGWYFRKPKDQGFSYRWEFGQRPGFKSYNPEKKSINFRNWYTMLTFGLYIPLKVKPIATED